MYTFGMFNMKKIAASLCMVVLTLGFALLEDKMVVLSAQQRSYARKTPFFSIDN